jgi:hypothetical protein
MAAEVELRRQRASRRRVTWQEWRPRHGESDMVSVRIVNDFKQDCTGSGWYGVDTWQEWRPRHGEYVRDMSLYMNGCEGAGFHTEWLQMCKQALANVAAQAW